MKRSLILVVLAVGVAAGAWLYLKPDKETPVATSGRFDKGEMVAVTVPQLTGDTARGAKVFGGFCADCHGASAGGIEGKGPPLIHNIYEPGHHGDFAFVRAAQQGVRSHHWRFGDMPPVNGVSDADIGAIIAFIRAVQRENGIF